MFLGITWMHTDPLSESRSSSIYVPRDEAFSEVKNATFSGNTVYSVLHAVVPALKSILVDADRGFPHFPAIDDLFNVGVEIPTEQKGILSGLIPRLIKSITDIGKDAILFETPEMIDSKLSHNPIQSFKTFAIFHQTCMNI